MQKHSTEVIESAKDNITMIVSKIVTFQVIMNLHYMLT